MRLSVLYPTSLKIKIKEALHYASLKTNPEKFITIMFFSSALISLILSFISIKIGYNIPVIVFIVSFPVICIFFYEYLLIKADTRARRIDEVLPDVLDLTSSNLKAGLTPERALLLSARPEFGPMEEELSKAGKDLALGKDLKTSLIKITERVNSEKVERVFSLIVSGVKVGGNLSDLLKQASMSLKKNELIEKKIRATVSVYVMFIFAAITFGGPFLFATSTFLIEMLGKMVGTLSVTETRGVPITLALSPIEMSTAFPLIIILITVTSVMASLIIGEISRGKARDGLKFMPFLTGASIAMFFIFRLIIGSVFGGLF